jgi:hypothetical protein
LVDSVAKLLHELLELRVHKTSPKRTFERCVIVAPQ